MQFSTFLTTDNYKVLVGMNGKSGIASFLYASRLSCAQQVVFRHLYVCLKYKSKDCIEGNEDI
ncbi:uncharacterized protein PHALS_15194 [Plasmopara halstedii]|uniref:Uncharacterized protein n=1 Tax=Plasmopara halstedii TaxID=4781 RepID=A0A0P1B5Y6_PLAHL|nr:uncharacterized protein PHALS_15194 [Plasmopara halstedii]CEG49108.1 hypothetical protein PHALS_15194 [Plasmopara halstedii]|eukprot:XP_024585477.1 hypothetical protein PHALS_15194 [Plasmopara halstedii]